MSAGMSLRDRPRPEGARAAEHVIGNWRGMLAREAWKRLNALMAHFPMSMSARPFHRRLVPLPSRALHRAAVRSPQANGQNATFR